MQNIISATLHPRSSVLWLTLSPVSRCFNNVLEAIDLTTTYMTDCFALNWMKNTNLNIFYRKRNIWFVIEFQKKNWSLLERKIWKMNMNRAQVWKVKVKSPKWMKINNIENSRNMNRAQVCQLTPGAYYCQVLASVQTPRQVQNVFSTQLYNQPTPPPPMFQMFSNQCFSEKTPLQCTYIIGQPRAHTP